MSSEDETLEYAADIISTADRDMGIDWYRAAKGMLRRLVQWNQEKDAIIDRLTAERDELKAIIREGGTPWASE